MGTGWDLGETVSPRRSNATGSEFRIPLMWRLRREQEKKVDRVQSV